MDTELIIDSGKNENNNQKKRTRGMRFFAFFQRNWSWLVPALVVFIVMLILTILSDVAPFGGNSLSSIDSMHQYVPFFSDYQRKLHSFESLFYSWNIGMGQNFFSLLLYYIASPLNLLLVLAPRSGIFAVFTFLVIIKLAFSAGAFGYWLSRRRGGRDNNMMISAFALGYAINAYMIGYSWNVMWLDCIMVLPLAILGMERIFRKESPVLYILSMFYILFCNFYIAFIICIFLVLWFFAHRYGSVKNFFRSGLVFAGCSLLAAAMAAFALLSAYLGIMTTSSAGKGFPEFSFYGNIFTLLKQHFFLTVPLEMQSFDGGLNAYCSVLAVLLFFVYLFSDRISIVERVKKLLLVAFLIFSFNTTTLNFIWHGFHDQYGIPNRFSFVYIFTLLTLAYEAYMRLKQTKVFRLALAGSATIIFFFLCFWYGKPDELLSPWLILLITLLLVIVYMIFIFLRKMGGMKIFTSTVVICSIVCTELLTNAVVGYAKNDVANGAYYVEYADSMEAAREQVEMLTESRGQIFWREDQALTRMLDEATYNGLRSVGTFCSTVGGNLVDTMGDLGCYTGVNEFLFYGGNPILNMLIGVRFTYVRASEYSGIASREDPIITEGKVRVYEDNYALSLGYGVPANVEFWESVGSNRIETVNDLARSLATTKRPYRFVTPTLETSGTACDTWVTEERPAVINFDHLNGSEDDMTITARFTVEEDGTYVMDTKVNKAEKLSYSVNGEEKGHERFVTQILDLGYLTHGDEVEITVEFEDTPPEGGTMSLYLARLDEEVRQQIFDHLSEQALEITKFSDGNVEGAINMKEDGLLFTSIPYDKGWTVKIDGEKVETMAIADTFLAVPVSEGRHEVTLHYVSPGFLPGLLVSAAAWVLFILIFCVFRRNKRKKRKNERKNIEKAEKKQEFTLHKEESDI